MGTLLTRRNWKNYLYVAWRNSIKQWICNQRPNYSVRNVAGKSQLQRSTQILDKNHAVSQSVEQPNCAAAWLIGPNYSGLH